MSITRTELKNLKALNSATGRREQGQFLAEGIRLLEEAARLNCRPSSVYYSETHLSERGGKLVTLFADRRISTKPISSKQMASISDTRTPQGLLATFDLPYTSPTELLSGAHRRVLLCEAISDPGNLGTLMRSARAFDFSLVALAGKSADPFSPKVVRSTAGALFGQKICYVGPDDLTRMVASEAVSLIAASQSGEADQRKLESVLKSRTLVVAIGSEGDGLSEELVSGADLVWRIVHTRDVESLNAAVAGSILMKQLFDEMD